MPPPPGKPVTFYECHPEDHAPAPSVRADLFEGSLEVKLPTIWTDEKQRWEESERREE